MNKRREHVLLFQYSCMNICIRLIKNKLNDGGGMRERESERDVDGEKKKLVVSREAQQIAEGEFGFSQKKEKQTFFEK